MKKLFKYLLILVILVAVLLAIAAVTVTRPGMQKSIFLSVMEDKAEKVEVDTLKAGPSNVTVTGLSVTQDGTIIELGSLDMQYSLWDLVFTKEVHIDDLKVSGLVVDLRNRKPATPSTDEAPKEKQDGGFPEFKGIFENAEIPAKVYVGTVAVDGKLLLPEMEQDFKVTGGSIAPGQEGKIELESQIQNQAPDAAAALLAIKAVLTLNQTAEQRLDRITLNTDINASGGTLSSPAAMSLAATAEHKADSEVYQLTVSSNNKQIAAINAEYSSAKDGIEGTLKAKLSRADLAPFLMNTDLPDFTVAMSEEFSLNNSEEKIVAGGSLALELRDLASWKPELASIGSGTLDAKLKAEMTPGQTKLDALTADFETSRGRKLVEIVLKKPFAIKTGDGGIKLDGASGELLAISLANLPIEWLTPFVPNVDLSGDDISASATLSASSTDAFSLASSSPWSLGNLSVVQNGKPILQAVTINLQPNLAINGKQVDVQLTNVQMTNGSKTLLAGELDVKTNMDNAAESTTATLRIQGDLAQLQSQPIMEPYHGLAGGSYSLSASAQPHSSGMAIDSSLSLSNLTLKQSFDQLRSASLGIKGVVDGADKIDIQGPLKIQGSKHNSDATMVTKFDRTQGVNQFDVSLTGQTLAVDDLQFLSKAFKNPNYQKSEPAKATKQTPTTTASSANDGPDEVAAWHGQVGKAVLAFETVYLGSNELKQLDAQLNITDESLRLTPLTAQLNGAPINGKAIIDFRAGNPKPYLLDSSIDLQKLEIGSLLSSTNNPKDSAVTGEFTFNGAANGEAPSLGRISETVMFDLNIKGGPGVVRSKGTPVSAVTNLTSTGLGLAGSIAQLAGVNAINDNPGLQSVNGLLKAISEEIKYELISFEALREKDLNINLKEFLLYSPSNELKFKGTGLITYQENVPIPDQPMVIQTQLWTKGKQSDLMNELKLAGSERDSDGYQAGFKFPITGTLSKPDYYSSLANALLSNATNIVGGIVGGAAHSASGIVTGGDETSNNANGETTEPQNDEQKAVRAFGGLLQGILNQGAQQQQQQQQTNEQQPSQPQQ
ncbi:MAG: hypothetical protein AAFX93_09675 [Verrucomicrobiota bacterium]